MKDSEALKPASKFSPVGANVEKLHVSDVHSVNNNFWYDQSVNLHTCYKKGNTYANNSKKKTSTDLIGDMFSILKQQYIDSADTPEMVDLVIENIKNNLQMLENITNNVDKNCILATIQGYTLGCLKKYEQQ